MKCNKLVLICSLLIMSAVQCASSMSYGWENWKNWIRDKYDTNQERIVGVATSAVFVYSGVVIMKKYKSWRPANRLLIQNAQTKVGEIEKLLKQADNFLEKDLVLKDIGAKSQLSDYKREIDELVLNMNYSYRYLEHYRKNMEGRRNFFWNCLSFEPLDEMIKTFRAKERQLQDCKNVLPKKHIQELYKYHLNVKQKPVSDYSDEELLKIAGKIVDGRAKFPLCTLHDKINENVKYLREGDFAAYRNEMVLDYLDALQAALYSSKKMKEEEEQRENSQNHKQEADNRRTKALAEKRIADSAAGAAKAVTGLVAVEAVKAGTDLYKAWKSNGEK